MNHDKLIPAVPAALLFAGAFSAFSSATSQLPSPTGTARALDHHQNSRIAQVGPRASEEDEEEVLVEIFLSTDTLGCPYQNAMSSCCIQSVEDVESQVFC